MKHKFTLLQKAAKRKLAILGEKAPNRKGSLDSTDITSIDERVSQLLEIVNKPSRPAINMLFFVMYDISSNRVRNLVAKYLVRKGCFRIQRSIFLADLPADVHDRIRSDLAEVQAAYDNNDSILIVPISEGYLDMMKIIGQQLDLDVMTHKKNTLFF